MTALRLFFGSRLNTVFDHNGNCREILNKAINNVWRRYLLWPMISRQFCRFFHCPKSTEFSNCFVISRIFSFSLRLSANSIWNLFFFVFNSCVICDDVKRTRKKNINWTDNNNLFGNSWPRMFDFKPNVEWIWWTRNN